MSSEERGEQAEPSDERAADDRYAFEDNAAERGEAPTATAGRDQSQSQDQDQDHQQDQGGNGEGQYRSEDGAFLGRDFNIPGVDPEDDDPYRWHTGEKRD